MSNVDAMDSNGKVTVSLKGGTAEITAGATGAAGSLGLSDETGTRRVRVTSGPPPPARAPGSIESPGAPGSELRWKAPPESLTLDGQNASVVIGSNQQAGTCYLTDDKGYPAVELLGHDGAVTVHGPAGTLSYRGGVLALKNDKQRERIVLNAGQAYCALGGNDWSGGIGLFPKSADNLYDWQQATIVLNGDNAEMAVGKKNNGGRIFIRSSSGEPTITLDGTKGEVYLGKKDNAGRLLAVNHDGAVTVTIDGNAGDVVLSNGDCAEDFDVAASEHDIEPGTVVVLDDDGAIHPCAVAYDGRVAGVVSGAGAYRPALVLDRRPSATPRLPVALLGKVYCKVDAGHAPVRVGDLLTCSPTAGHAMKASDRDRAFGAVLGKALRSLDDGCALIPILVMLQ